MYAVLALALVTTTLAANDNLVLQPGDKAPPYSMRDLDNTMFSLRDLIGTDYCSNETYCQAQPEVKKTVIQVFFATWCEPCIAELDAIRKIETMWKTREVEVIHVGLSQSAEELVSFALEQQINWRIIPDKYALLSRRYGVGQLPHLFIINRDGNIAYQKRGLDPNLFDTLNAQLSLATGYEPPTLPSKRALNAAQSIDTPRFDTTLKFARAPSSRNSSERWQPLASFVAENVQATIEMVQETSYGAFERNIKKGAYDLFNAGPVLCSNASDQYEPLVLIEREGSPSYTGITFVQRQSKIRSISDLKGKTLGLVSPTSTSGGLYPTKLLLDAGLRPGKDVRIKWLGSHAKVAKALRKGKVHAAACFDDCRDLAWHSDRDKARATRIISYTDDIPAEMIMVKRTLSSEQKQLMREALTLAQTHGGILRQISRDEAPISGIVAADESNLAPIRAVLERVAANK